MATEPVHVVRFGLIKCEISRHQTRTGERFNVTLCRLYRDGSVWKSSKILGLEDLLVAAKALDLCHTWIFEQRQSVRPDTLDGSRSLNGGPNAQGGSP